MSQFTFELAKREDDPTLREIIRNNPMDGDISLSFQREPNYFQAVSVEGRLNQIVVGRERENNKIVGFGTRSIKPVFVNGKICDIGYLSNLRLDPAYRGRNLIARGYKYFKELHQDERARIYLSTIMNDNLYAVKILTGKRAGLPAYHDYGEYFTMAVSLCRKKRVGEQGFEIVKGTHELLDEIIAFIHKHGVSKQFYPYYTKDDFLNSDGFLSDFQIGDFYVAFKNKRIIGVIAKWDQSRFKQTIVSDYTGKVKLLRPLYNAVAGMLGFPILPKSGSKLNYFYVSFIAVESNSPHIFQALLDRLYNDHVKSDYDYFLVGFHSRDSLLSVLGRYRHIKLKSRLYIVCFDDGNEFFRRLDDRIPYLEIGTL